MMTTIKKKIYEDEDLTILIVSGQLTSVEAFDIINEFHEGRVTRNLLLDVSDAEMSSIKSNHLLKIIEITKSYAHLRKGGKTAFVVQKDLNFGLSRMYETLAELEKHTIHHEVFREREEALMWLKSK